MERKYIVTKIDGEPIPEDEPLFILRGQDILAPSAVLYYQRMLRDNGLDEQANAVGAIALEMGRWPTKKVPD